jgi:hypothetical protein
MAARVAYTVPSQREADPVDPFATTKEYVPLEEVEPLPCVS